MKQILSSNAAKDRLIRTIIQGLIGVIIANLDTIVGFGPFTPEIKALIVALTMAVLSPIMAYFGTGSDPEPELQNTFADYDESELIENETEEK